MLSVAEFDDWVKSYKTDNFDFPFSKPTTKQTIMELKLKLDNLVDEYLENFDVCLPAKIEQKNISNILLMTDEEISLQKEKLEKIKAQRKILQQYLLTGIVRV